MMNANQDLFQKLLNNSTVTVLGQKCQVIQGVAFALPLKFDWHHKQSIQQAAEMETRYRNWIKSHCPTRWN